MAYNHSSFPSISFFPLHYHTFNVFFHLISASSSLSASTISQPLTHLHPFPNRTKKPQHPQRLILKISMVMPNHRKPTASAKRRHLPGCLPPTQKYSVNLPPENTQLREPGAAASSRSEPWARVSGHRQEEGKAYGMLAVSLALKGRESSWLLPGPPAPGSGPQPRGQVPSPMQDEVPKLPLHSVKGKPNNQRGLCPTRPPLGGRNNSRIK